MGERAFGTVMVCGAGVAGASVARALLRRGGRVLLSDRVESEAVHELVALGARFVGAIDAVPPGVDLVVTSPGWRPDHPLFADAAAHGVEVMGELEFAWRLRGA